MEFHDDASMTKANLRQICENARELLKILEDNNVQNLEDWVEEKVAISNNDLSTALDYVKYYFLEEDHSETDKRTKAPSFQEFIRDSKAGQS